MTVVPASSGPGAPRNEGDASSIENLAADNSPWRPLHYELFRVLWIASVASNVGTWMHSVGVVWMMTTLSPSPTMVALVQTAGSLPLFFLAFPAGALADIVDRRKLLLFSQAWMLVAAGGLGLLTFLGLVGPWSLLAFTFLLGAGSAMNGPAWQAIMPELVDRPDLASAITLNGVGMNLARAVGPALGGLIVALAGAGAVFLLNAASFLGVMVVLYRWKREARVTVAPAERTLGAIRAGFRYMKFDPDFRILLIRTGGFILPASALWALLPVVARDALKVGSGGYGLLLGGLGAGAVVTATALPWIRQRLRLDRLVMIATLLFGGATLALAFTTSFPLACAEMVMGGVAWMALMSSLNVAAQTSVPRWVQARALAAYALVFQGGMAIASAAWGELATRAGTPVALRWAAVGLALSAGAGLRFRLRESDKIDLSPSMHWPEPVLTIEPQADDGPILITVEYFIEPEDASAFQEAMREMERIRRRDGAMRWGLYNDLSNPERYLETFVVESWAEHLRQHERITLADREVETRVLAFHRGGDRPVVSHLIHAYSGQ